jgi:hypothetical protein
MHCEVVEPLDATRGNAAAQRYTRSTDGSDREYLYFLILSCRSRYRKIVPHTSILQPVYHPGLTHGLAYPLVRNP